MTLRSARIGVLLLAMSAALGANSAHADDSTQKRASAAFKAAEDKRIAAQERLKEAEQKLKDASADTKQAAERALEAAKRGAEAAQNAAAAAALQVRAATEHAGAVAGDKLGQAKEAIGRAKDEARDVAHEAHAEAHEATDKALGKASALKADVEAATVKAKQEAEGAVEHAGETIHHMQATAQQIVHGAVGATNETARLRMARRAAWRQLASDMDKPESVPPSVREELRRHAQRIARLQRIRTLANEKADTALVSRADKLIERENARHQKKLAAMLTPLRAKRMANNKVGAAAEDEADPAEEAVEEEEEQQQ